jgi:hypothetical protein
MLAAITNLLMPETGLLVDCRPAQHSSLYDSHRACFWTAGDDQVDGGRGLRGRVPVSRLRARQGFEGSVCPAPRRVEVSAIKRD